MVFETLSGSGFGALNSKVVPFPSSCSWNLSAYGVLFSLKETGCFSLLQMVTSLDPEARDAARFLRSPNAVTDFASKQVRYAMKTSNFPLPPRLSFELLMPRWSFREDS